MTYVFVPPAVTYYWPTEGDYRSSQVFPLDHGQCVLVVGDTVTVQHYATEAEAAACDFFYRGGCRYDITEAEAAVLYGAGLTVQGYPA